MVRKLLVVTAGTVAAGVGLETREQMKQHPSSELNLMLRCIDTAFLPNHYETLKAGEWFQLSIESRHMAALYKRIEDFPRLGAMLYPGLLPETDMAGSGGIRYNGAAAVEVQRNDLRRWLSTSMADLATSGDRNTKISIAIIVSAVGGTGSGSLERLVEVIIDAADHANIKSTTQGTIRCDVFILQPGMRAVTDLGLANTLALYAELAASQLSMSPSSLRSYQGRKIMIGWGSNFALSSIEQLKEAAATIIRVANVPTSELVADFPAREVDNHVLRELDPLTYLPMHLSLATAVTINFGHLETQVFQRDMAYLTDNFVFGKTLSGSQTNILLGKLKGVLTDEDVDGRYKNLLNYLSEVIPLNSMGTNLDAMIRNKNISISERTNRLITLWQEYKEEIKQGDQSIQDRGKTLVANTINQLEDVHREYLYQGSISLIELRKEYRALQMELVTTLTVAREDIQPAVNDTTVTKQQDALAKGWPFNLFNREAKLRNLANAIRRNLQEYLRIRSRSTTIDTLEQLVNYCTEIGRNLDIVLQKLRRQLDSYQDRGNKSQQLKIDSGHPLHLMALSGSKELNRYSDQISIFTPRANEHRSSSTDIQDGNELAEFRQSLEGTDILDDLFKGNIELFSTAAQSYVHQKIHDEAKKHSVIDILLESDEKMLRQRLSEAEVRVAPLVSYSNNLAPYKREAWYVSAYYKSKEQREIIQRAMNQVFTQGQCQLFLSSDPTEVAIFYYVDGIPMSAVDDLKGRCLEAFLRYRLDWYRMSKLSTGNSPLATINSLNQRISIPVYSGMDAEQRVRQTGVISHVYEAGGAVVRHYSAQEIPELSLSAFTTPSPAQWGVYEGSEDESEQAVDTQRTKESPLSLFALARATLEDDDKAFVGKSYSVQVGISQSKPENFKGEPFDLLIQNMDKPVSFDILLQTSENIQLTTTWHKPLIYDSGNLEPQLAEFTFQVIAPGTCYLVIDFYQERRWLTRTRLEFDAVEQSQLTTVSSEV